MKMVIKKVEKSQSVDDQNVDDKMILIKKNISSLKISLIFSYMFTIVVALFLICFMKSEIETTVQRILMEHRDNPLKSDSPKYHQYSKNTNKEHYERKSSSFMNDQDDQETRAKRETLNKEPAANDSHVEFFDPKMRSELEKRDAEIIKRTGAKGAAPNGDTWVWLTAYSRLPYDAITGFCKATKEYCPPGPSGLPGIQGPKGIKGDLGTVGPKGMDGKIGKIGKQGPKGEEGIGKPGLDGRDGMNGEPGLDGVPGRAGIDGIPGTKGKDGINGIDGKDGRDGSDGTPGPIGPPGNIGNQGPRGLTGPRGRVGKAGKDGSNGIPGVSLWTVNINGSSSSDYLIPPSISTAGLLNYEKIKPIVVYEGDNLRLRCATIGSPQPMIEWIREDTRTINNGAWEANSLTGHTLNITKINRVHMGTYKCISNNGIPPIANQNFQIDVHFSPWVHVKSTVIYADYGSSQILECEVEGFPEPIRYWEKVPDKTLIEANEQDKKYTIESTSSDTYKFTMRLNITNLQMQDYGEYNCIAKNELGIAKGLFRLHNNDNSITRPKSDGSFPVTFGKNPPEKQSYEEICGAPTTCPECLNPKDFKCKDTIFSLYDLVGGELEIKQTENISYPGFPNRNMDCVLHAVGKPVFHNHIEILYGAWMKDSNSKEPEKIYLTKDGDFLQLYEYNSKANYRKNVPTKTYRLPHPFKGNAHVVYNGSFYYYRRDETKIIKYDLALEKLSVMKEIQNVSSTNYLYSSEINVVDFNVDDNGLWIIYSTPVSNHTIVSKLHETTLEVQYSWNISVNQHKVGEMFIVCGVLYAIDSVTEHQTKIRLALDLVERKLLDVTLSFTNPFSKTTTVGYNPRDKELYSWDDGNQLTYPVRYHDMGYNQTIGEKNDGMMNPFTGYVAFRRFRNNTSKPVE